MNRLAYPFASRFPASAAAEPHAVTVLYVAGSGRCGSTLLDRVLGQHPQFLPLGEARRLPRELSRPEARCSCGEPFSDCQFWGQLVSDGDVHLSPREHDAFTRAERKLRAVPWLLGARDTASTYRLSVEVVGRFLEQLYRLVRDRAQAERTIIVDSSKDPMTLSLLADRPGIDVRVVHLVRDPRATAYAWARPKHDPAAASGSASLPTYPPARTAAWWVLVNAALASFGSRQPERYLQVTYEDLVANPSRALAEIGRLAGVEGLAGLIDDERAIDLRPIHTVQGNPDRFISGTTRVSSDEEWRRSMPRTEQLLVTAMTGPWLKRYGYRCSTTRSPRMTGSPRTDAAPPVAASSS